MIDPRPNSQPVLSVIVPCFNEAENLDRFVPELTQVLERMRAAFEVLLIDDGSTDRTWETILGFATGSTHIHGIRLSRNFGKESAICAGLKCSSGDRVAVIDADGQHPPRLIPSMIERMEKENCDIVSAVKQPSSNNGLLSRLFSRSFNWLFYQLTKIDLVNMTDYKLMNRTVVNNLLSFPENIRFFRGLVHWMGFNHAAISFTAGDRMVGETKWPRRALFAYALDALVSFTAKPLVLAFYASIAGFVISFIIAIQALYSWFAGIAVSGWTSLTIVIAFFSSMILLSIGLIGIYLERIFIEVKNRPIYLVREATFESPRQAMITTYR